MQASASELASICRAASAEAGDDGVAVGPLGSQSRPDRLRGQQVEVGRDEGRSARLRLLAREDGQPDGRVQGADAPPVVPQLLDRLLLLTQERSLEASDRDRVTGAVVDPPAAEDAVLRRREESPLAPGSGAPR